MTDNEKRAHDLAIAMVPVMYEINVQSALSTQIEKTEFDVYATYVDIYERSLKAINRDFPEL